jgi:hypothetical protein
MPTTAPQRRTMTRSSSLLFEGTWKHPVRINRTPIGILRVLSDSSKGECLGGKAFEPFKHLSRSDIMWLTAMGWVAPHLYESFCISGGCCATCEPCACDFGLYQ